jgi:hypothetical protein
MSPATTSTTPIPSASTKSDATPKNDHRILIVVVILGIVAAFLIAYIVYITIRLKRRQTSGQDLGPYQGTAMTQDHPAANITPFGSVGPHSGGNFPRFSAYLLTVFYSLLVAKLFFFVFLCFSEHNPGEDMRIAIRRPDGAWHFTDSRTPFTPAGVSEIDVTPSPISTRSTASLLSFHSSSRFPSNKAIEVRTARDLSDDFGFRVDPTAPPPPAYHREPCQPHFDDHQT